MPPKVLIPMADDGHDPTETSVPYSAFKAAGFQVDFATETGKVAQCDQLLLTGITQKLLGATAAVISKYNAMAASPEFTNPRSWSAPGFSLDSYSLVFLPGGHEKGVRQLINSPIMAKNLATYFPQCKKPSTKSAAAVCHGVLSLAEAKLLDGEDAGKSVIHACQTTTLPARFEQAAFWGTRLFMGDYYKTYGAGSDDVEVAVTRVLDSPELFKGSIGMGSWVVEDDKFNYISARFPGDVELMAEKVVAMVEATAGA